MFFFDNNLNTIFVENIYVEKESAPLLYYVILFLQWIYYLRFPRNGRIHIGGFISLAYSLFCDRSSCQCLFYFVAIMRRERTITELTAGTRVTPCSAISMCRVLLSR